ncbi:prepilin peptidase [Campylobacter lari]|uniref:prepilin peptidase n=2 Tax=Campylobacter lari TaxID=201 RepID=UPI00126E3D6E|nr:A24 family peptidase [Campylobacter lari]EAH5176704.1 prepilin peptidase [Campylobacter lari]EAH6261478.1 prepilin peptidase [Campylobacter lari]EAI3912043.1 prepilin peptidase [Campylobacter lari]EAI4302373.1 prepilin peptidase [Campylobacter lari]EAI4840996.1 prepilin peptidase [Campylobacter lari]
MIFYILLGLCIGSFINVVIFRSKQKKSIVSPRSYCLKCNNTLKFYHLIPILSYVFLKGKCGFCKGKISLIYPFNELICGCLFAFAFYLFENIFEILIFACILAIFLMLSWMDYFLKAVSELWLWILFALAFLFDFLQNGLKLENIQDSFLFKACFGAGVVFLLKSMINFVKNFKKRDEILESLGEGDVIIIAIIFGIFGYEGAFFILFTASLLCLFGFIKIAKKDYQMPMIPFLFVAILVQLCSESLK